MPLSGARARAETLLTRAVTIAAHDVAKPLDPLKPMYTNGYTKQRDARSLRIPLARRLDLSENPRVIHLLSMRMNRPSGLGTRSTRRRQTPTYLLTRLLRSPALICSDLATADLASWRTGNLCRPIGVHTFGCACKAALGSGRMKFQTYRQLGLGESRVWSRLVSSTSVTRTHSVLVVQEFTRDGMGVSQENETIFLVGLPKD